MSTASILSIVRTELRDEGTKFSASVTADGNTAIFDLPYEHVDPTTFQLYNSTTTPNLQNPSTYTLDQHKGIVYLGAPATAGAVLTAQGTAYRFFTDDQLIPTVQRGFALHVAGRYPAVYLDPPATPSMVALPGIEEYLVALLALIEALWILATDESYDIDVLTPEGVQIPRQQRFAAILQIIQARSDEYRDLSARLNVGLDAITMFTLRRISPSTGRYVPVYIPREYDAELRDPTQATPQRVLPPIDSGLTI